MYLTYVNKNTNIYIFSFHFIFFLKERQTDAINFVKKFINLYVIHGRREVRDGVGINSICS